jgi:anti-sigma factor RsiW
MHPIEQLEALAQGTLPESARASVEAHVAGCPACADELAWLRQEAALMQRRRAQQPALSPALWSAIERQIAGPAPPAVVAAAGVHRLRRLGARLAYGGLLAAAAAAVVVATWPGQIHQRPADLGPVAGQARRAKVPAEVAVERAEREYLDVAKTLEDEYQRRRAWLPAGVVRRYDNLIAQTRTRVADARVQAGNDLDGRLVVLDGYAEYVNSLQTIVSDLR